MIRTIAHALFVVAGLALAAPAHSAGYLKIGDIKGESTDDRHGTTIDRAPASPQPTAPSRVQGNDTPKPAGLLLPAVQKAQEAPAATPPGNVQGNEPPKPAGLLLPAVQKAQEPAPAQGAKGKKKGNVEYQWKVEEGQK